MPRDSLDAWPGQRRRRRALVVAGVVLLAAIVLGMVLQRTGDEPPKAGVTVGWGGSEGHPSCVFDPSGNTVDATLSIEGTAPRRDTVTVTVTAYADENTSQPVGSSSRSVPVEGTVDMQLVVTIPVERSPYVDIDGETACALDVEY